MRYFIAAAEEENVSRAALKLHVSQPALSRQIRDLEDELRFPLFQRTAKSVQLTDAGRAFLGEARDVLKRADDAVDRARAIASGGRGELHVGYAPSPTARILPTTLRAFKLEFECREKISAAVYRPRSPCSISEFVAGRAGRLTMAEESTVAD